MNGVMRRLFDAQRAASRSEPAFSLVERRARLDILADCLVRHQREIVDTIDADFGGRAEAETNLLEIVPTLNAIRHARRSLASWMKPERRRVAWQFRPGKAWVRYEPLGVVGIISPWNYPLLLALAPLVDALAAGNRVLLKPSELTPRFSDLLARMLAERFDPTHVSVITGGVEIGQAFSRLPFDHLVFTGSTPVGRLVAEAAASNLTPVTLELGGKSPAIVCPDYPFDKAAKSISFGKFINAGQTCIAPDYVLVPQGSAHAFAELVMKQARRAYGDCATNADYAGVITPRHRERLEQMVSEAEQQGATVYALGDRSGIKLPPMAVIGAPDSCRLMQEEIFGPVLPVLEYRGLPHALTIIARRERPLALYCFTRDSTLRDNVLNGATSGGVTVNATLLHIAQDDLPFGGIGPSGSGAYHGLDGFRRLSHARAVFQASRFNIFERLGPPWTKSAQRVARRMIGAPGHRNDA